MTGRHRDYARAALRQALKPRVVKPRKARAPTYGPRIIAGLVTCWAVLRAPAGKRLAPILPVLVPLLRRDGELELSDDEAEQLMGMSAATIERRLAREREMPMPRGRSHTKPGSLLKSQIPVRTWAEWDDVVPGFVEMDLVGHEGGNGSGKFCFTLTVTDIATGWTVNRSVRNKAQKWVFEALQHVVASFPFPIRGIDSDNGSEFINDYLLRWCIEQEITFTRSRPGNKNDGAHVERKNWSRVRELVGYYRYDTGAELAELNEIWALDAVFANYLLPRQELNIQAVSRREGDEEARHRHDTAPAGDHAQEGGQEADHQHERRLQAHQAGRALPADPGSDWRARGPRSGQEGPAPNRLPSAPEVPSHSAEGIQWGNDPNRPEGPVVGDDPLTLDFV